MANNKIANVGIHHLALTAVDFDKSMKFYTEPRVLLSLEQRNCILSAAFIPIKLTLGIEKLCGHFTKPFRNSG